MCGRYTLIRLSQFTDLFPWIRSSVGDWPARYNVAPTQLMPVVFADDDGDDFVIEPMRWGLVPGWATDLSVGSRMINARAETLADKPAFRVAVKRRRCAVPASGFYEWRREPGGSKTPIYIRPADHAPRAFAGLWETWTDRAKPDAPPVRTFTIITTTPNDLMKSIHDRMPAILPDESSLRTWLAPGELDGETRGRLLAPVDSSLLAASPVSRAVNNPRNDSPACLAPVEKNLFE